MSSLLPPFSSTVFNGTDRHTWVVLTEAETAKLSNRWHRVIKQNMRFLGKSMVLGGFLACATKEICMRTADTMPHIGTMLPTISVGSFCAVMGLWALYGHLRMKDTMVVAQILLEEGKRPVMPVPWIFKTSVSIDRQPSRSNCSREGTTFYKTPKR